MTRAPRRTLAIFLLALSVLTLEVALTRIFSFIMFHHFTYLVISVAMLGFGAAGTYLTTRPRNDDPAADNEFLATHACRFGLTTLAAVAFIPRIRFYPMDMYFLHDYSHLLSLLLIVVLAAAPFFFAGVCIAHIVSRAGEAINRVYFADLAGASCGCLAALLAINQFGANVACFAVAGLDLFVAALVGVRRRRLYALGVIAMLGATVMIARKDFLPLYAPSYKQMFGKEHLIERTQWHVITRLDIERPRQAIHSFGGALSRNYKGPWPETRFIYQDASALTGIIRPTPTPKETPILGYYLQGAPYQLKRQSGESPRRCDALVIGCGGGVDILIALHHEVGSPRRLVGVDVNPHTIDMIKGRYNEFGGGVFRRPDVELIASEGRHFLSRDARRFDVIQLSGVDTFSALSTGAYALSENFIYTAEALDQYLAHLQPDGLVNISRPYFEPPREQLKLTATCLEALERSGQSRRSAWAGSAVADATRPWEHLVIIKGVGLDAPAQEPWAQTMVKRSPFTRAEVETLARWTERLGFDMVYDPFTRRPGELETLIRAEPAERGRFIAGHRLNIEPATDDKPFVFQFYRWSDLFHSLKGQGSGVRPPLALIILLGSFVLIAVLSGAFILYPLHRSGIGAARPGGRTGIFVYFAALGMGFILVEIALLQKFTIFLGGPTYSMSITLFTILLATGLGSALSRNWSARPFRLLAVVMPLLIGAIIVASLVLDRTIAGLMGMSHLARALTAVVLVAPLGLLMGMAFPTGLRHVDRHRPELNPWAWGINACATVLGTLLCILFSASFGFRAALLLGAAIYLVGWLVFTATQRGLPARQ